MKNKNLTVILAALTLTGAAAAQDGKPKIVFTPSEKAEIAWAIKVLSEAEILKADENGCAKFDYDFIEDLKKTGLLKEGDSKVSTVCIGSRETKRENK